MSRSSCLYVRWRSIASTTAATGATVATAGPRLWAGSRLHWLLTCHASAATVVGARRRRIRAETTSPTQDDVSRRDSHKEGTDERTRRIGAGARGVVAAALASTAGAGSSAVARIAGRELQGDDEARTYHAAHRRRRLHRPGAADLGEVRREDAAEAVRAQGPAPPRRHACREGLGEALVVAQKFIADPKVVAMLGPRRRVASPRQARR